MLFATQRKMNSSIIIQLANALKKYFFWINVSVLFFFKEYELRRKNLQYQSTNLRKSKKNLKLVTAMIHDWSYFADFLGVNHRKGPSEDCEVLAEDVRRTAVDQSVSGDYRIARNFFLKKNRKKSDNFIPKRKLFNRIRKEKHQKRW